MKREIFQIKFEWKSKHILHSITFFPKIVPFMRKRGKEIGQPDRPQMIISGMRFARKITKATDTHSEYVILNGFYCKKMFTRTRFDVTFIRALPIMLTLNFKVHKITIGLYRFITQYGRNVPYQILEEFAFPISMTQ